jgi:hypothetical protein
VRFSLVSSGLMMRPINIVAPERAARELRDQLSA